MTQGIATSKNKQYILVNYAEGKMHDNNKILCFSRGPLFLCGGGRWNAIWKSFDLPPQLLDPFLVTFLDDSVHLQRIKLAHAGFQQFQALFL